MDEQTPGPPKPTTTAFLRRVGSCILILGFVGTLIVLIVVFWESTRWLSILLGAILLWGLANVRTSWQQNAWRQLSETPQILILPLILLTGFIFWAVAGFPIEKNLAAPGSTSAVKITSIAQLDCNIEPCRRHVSGDPSYKYQIEVILKPTKRTIPDKPYQVKLRVNDGARHEIFGVVEWDQFDINNRKEQKRYFLVSRDVFVNDVRQLMFRVHGCAGSLVSIRERCATTP